jgi:hypothetical protein
MAKVMEVCLARLKNIRICTEYVDVRRAKRHSSYLSYRCLAATTQSESCTDESWSYRAAKTSVWKASSSWLTSSRASWSVDHWQHSPSCRLIVTTIANVAGIQKNFHPLSMLRERILPRLNLLWTSTSYLYSINVTDPWTCAVPPASSPRSRISILPAGSNYTDRRTPYSVSYRNALKTITFPYHTWIRVRMNNN